MVDLLLFFGILASFLMLFGVGYVLYLLYKKMIRPLKAEAQISYELIDIGKPDIVKLVKNIIKPTKIENIPINPISEIKAPEGIIPIDSDIKMFKDTYDTDYENAVNVSALEISHAHTTHQTQLQIQLEKEKRKRLIS